jgi:hypothetical protein
VLVCSSEPVAERMAGPAIRAYELARVLARRCEVTLAAPAPCAPADPAVRPLAAGPRDVEALWAAARAHDVVVAQELGPTLLDRLAGSEVRLVADLYNPIVVEVLEAVAERSPASQERIATAVAARTRAMLAAADLVICANERQRDLWIGGLALAGRLDVAAYRADPMLRSLVAVVPFGVPDAPPPVATGALRAALPGIAPADRVLLWGGGIWSWLDPVTPMRAVARLAAADGPRTHLVFLGAGRPGLAATGQAGAVERALEHARRERLLGRLVHVNPGWVPYAERGAWLAEADLGVCAHHDHLEARFAHRTRILDCVWAGLPVVATAGDPLADLVAGRDLGVTVAPGDDAAFAAACARLLGPDGALARERAAGLRAESSWERAAAPLAAWCEAAPNRPRARRRGARARVRRATLAQLAAALPEFLAEEGPRATAARVGRRVRRSFTLR